MGGRFVVVLLGSQFVVSLQWAPCVCPGIRVTWHGMLGRSWSGVGAGTEPEYEAREADLMRPCRLPFVGRGCMAPIRTHTHAHAPQLLTT